MSNYAQGWAWQQKVSATDKLVLIALADHSDDDGNCWPGLRGIAGKCGLTKRTVSASIQRLQSSNLLSVTPRVRPDGSRTSNQYLLLLDSRGMEGNNTTPMKETALGIEAGGGTRTVIEPSVESSDKLIKENQVVWPEWFALGYGLKGWSVSVEVAEQWRTDNNYSLEYCLDKIYVLRGWWTKDHEKKGRNPYSTFQRACRENWAGNNPSKQGAQNGNQSAPTARAVDPAFDKY